MSLISVAVGKVADFFGKGADLGGKITENKTKRILAKTGDKIQIENNRSAEQMQVLKQYASEFTGKQGIVEKFNKIVRPLFAVTAWIVFGVRYLTPMIIFITKGLSLTELMEIYNILWVSDKWIIGGIIGFYFGGRMQTKAHDNKNNNLLNEKISEILAVKEAEEKKKPEPVQTDPEMVVEYEPTCSGRFSKPETLEMLKEVGRECFADKMIVTGADRSPEVHAELIKEKKTKATYNVTQHGAIQGYKAGDIKLYKDGVQIEPLTVAKIARSVAVVGGIGVYGSFTHIDRRERKPDGSIYKWGDWS